MDRVRIETVETGERPAVESRRVGAQLGTDSVAVNHYTVPPGGRISGLHAHAEQEEVFVVLEARVVFETLAGRVRVSAGEAIRFAPGEYQSCTNPGETRAVVLALGAPVAGGEVWVPVACPDCGHAESIVTVASGVERLTCPACGAEREPSCHACGGGRLRAVLDEDGSPVSRCRDCGALTPPG